MQSLSPMRLAVLAATSILLASCGGSDDPAPVPAPEETRAQDSRTFTANRCHDVRRRWPPPPATSST